MKTIRSNCFETNSSSTHSLTIDKSPPKRINLDKLRNLRIECGEFGWEWKKLDDFETKCSYFWTLAQHESSYYPQAKHLKSRLMKLSKKYGFVLVEPNDSVYHYVDHGFEHYFENFVKKYPEIESVDGLLDVLTLKSAVIFLGNDNGTDPPNFRFTDYEIKNAAKRVKIVMPNGETFTQILPRKYKKEDVERVVQDLIYYSDDKRSFSDGYLGIKEFTENAVRVTREKYDYATRSHIEIEAFEIPYTIEDNE